MGTSFDVGIPEEQVGIIPRAAQHLFDGIQKRRDEAEEAGRPVPEFKVCAQFLEVSNLMFQSLLSFFLKFILFSPGFFGRFSHFFHISSLLLLITLSN